MLTKSFFIGNRGWKNTPVSNSWALKPSLNAPILWKRQTAFWLFTFVSANLPDSLSQERPKTLLTLHVQIKYICVSFAFSVGACQQGYIRPEFISILVENKPFFTLVNSISVCLVTKNVTLNLMDLTRRRTFQLFFHWRLWMSLPKLLWQLWDPAASKQNSAQQTGRFICETRNRERQRKLQPRGRGSKGLLRASRNRRREPGKAGEIPILFCYSHFCFQITLNWEGEGRALLIPKNSKRPCEAPSWRRAWGPATPAPWEGRCSCGHHFGTTECPKIMSWHSALVTKTLHFHLKVGLNYCCR